MKIEGAPFQLIEWSSVEPSAHPGESGSARWRTVEAGNVRVRIVEYSPGYLADHWCSRGHVVHVLAGSFTTELQDGRALTLEVGQCYVVADDAMPHRSRTTLGVTLLIVD